MFLEDYWYIAAFRREIGDKPIRRILLGKPVVMYRAPDGGAVVLEDRCVHRNVPLSLGTLLPGGQLQCRYHGLRYDQTGACVHIPEQTRVPADARVKRYPAVERAEWVWVWMGAPDTADPATIPPYRWFVQPGWRSRIGYLHVNCSYRLIVDNLLNMAHLPFVHGGTIGSEGVVKDAKVSVQRDGERVRLARRMYDIEPPPTYKQARGFEGKVSRWQIIDFAAPGYFEFDTGLIDAGHEIPDISPDRPLPSNARILSRHAMHGVAPESAASTHYYFGFTYDPADHTEQMADFLFDGMLKTFIEDVEVLEAQQANMALTPGAHVIDIVSDTAGLQATRIIDEIERRN